jgi:glycosyltransferase involved in cell wall biosynthesis
MGQPRIAFVSREVYPFDSAGLGNYVTFSAAALAPHAEVAILTSDLYEERYHELVEASDPRLPDGVRFEFVAEPKAKELPGWYEAWHLWSARAFEAIVRLYPEGAPDLVEFPDFCAEGFVAAQAVQTDDPRIRNTTVAIRAYTTAEMCAVLDGFVPDERHVHLLCDLERYALRHAHHFVWPGGDVLGTYERFYGADAIPDPVMVPHTAPSAPGPAAAGGDHAETRFLYVGRLESRKGVQNLIRAVRMLEAEEWSLTLIGADTDTAPLGTSMRDQLDLMIAEDPRIRLIDRVPREELAGHYARADVVVSPSLWECWPNTILEAFAADRPVLATPVGGHVGMVEDGRCGWLAADTSAVGLAEGLERVIAARRAGESPAPGRARGRFDELTDPEAVAERYLAILAKPRSSHQPPRSEEEPLVSVIVPYFRMDAFVEEALASVRAQTYGNIEIVLVNDGSLRAQDAILESLAERFGCRLVTQPNAGLGQARNFGLDLALGRYVLPFDPDDLLLPAYVERCVDVLERRSEVAYVTAWSRYINEDGTEYEGGYRPIGNTAAYTETENVAGSAMSVFRSEVFDGGLRYSPDLTSFEDWFLFRQLRAAGDFGHVIPETLLVYRVRETSMLRELTRQRDRRLAGELEAHVREAEVEWVAAST